MASRKKTAKNGGVSKTPDPTLRRMERVAKDFFELPPFEDQAEWEAELLRKLESENEAKPESDEDSD